MKQNRNISDQVAIGLSVLCAIHCVAMPLLVVLLPATLAAIIGSEGVHLWMLLAVIPFSAFALYNGCKQHGRFNIAAIGITGMISMVVAVFAIEPSLGHEWEMAVTVLGAMVIAAAHFKNYRLCQLEKGQSV